MLMSMETTSYESRSQNFGRTQESGFHPKVQREREKKKDKAKHKELNRVLNSNRNDPQHKEIEDKV